MLPPDATVLSDGHLKSVCSASVHLVAHCQVDAYTGVRPVIDPDVARSHSNNPLLFASE